MKRNHLFWFRVISKKAFHMSSATDLAISDGSGSGQFFVARVGLGQPPIVWVRIWKISPKNVKFFNFFPSGQKKLIWVESESTRIKAGLASYLLRVKSKLRLGQGPSLLATLRVFKWH